MEDTSQRRLSNSILEEGYTAGVMFKFNVEDEQELALSYQKRVGISFPLSMEMLQSHAFSQLFSQE